MPMSSLDNPDAAPSDPQVLRTLQDAEVETHFPFEPYKLPLTKSYIEGIYREFEAPEGLEEEDLTTEDEDPDDSAASSLSISVESTGFGHRGLPIPSVTGKQRAARTTAGTSMDQDDAGFSKSFEAMSISPARR